LGGPALPVTVPLQVGRLGAPGFLSGGMIGPHRLDLIPRLIQLLLELPVQQAQALGAVLF
jgi:hypothetical protein